MRNNQMGRRNLTAAWRIELQAGNAEDLKRRGRAQMSAGGKGGVAKQGLSPSDKPSEPPPSHNTQREIGPDDDAKAERGLRDVLHALSVVPAGERRDLRRKARRRKARAA